MISEFWEDVQTAYQQVANNQKREITVAREGKRAEIYWNEYDISVVVRIFEEDTSIVEPLVAP